ncbi:hypothetical protein QN277_004101 [Acacia crassicarpa]|uniref:WRKY domain-containing protein n=1 Tax=Acacia crassicarpa TaxID=499986 RepID=A0AAE1JXA1_9FABA|nr:hypothetical protein QN277_004101 [Acacia crassicarpa]
MRGTGDQLPPSSEPPPPPRTSMDTLFNGVSSGGAGFGFNSPGPMTLVSNFFNENDDFKSFSQLLAGAMPLSPLTTDGSASSTGLKEQLQMFMVSPAGYNGPPRLFPASQVSAPAVPVNEHTSSAAESMAKQVDLPRSSSIPDSGTTSMKECPNDGFNWRKYGQKQVKGSEFPRSYYKCTHPNCGVKKKVERSIDDDHVVAIIYKGQHNHQPPRPTNKGATCWDQSSAAEHEAEGLSESDEEDAEVEQEKNDEPDLKKRRNTQGMVASEGVTSHRTAMEPRIIVQTTSEVDLLDDGYRWRKYGQKLVKGSPFPRSYYKCTTTGCNVRKHVERATSDPKAVITTYEGKHNHEVPAAKTNSHTFANSSASSQLRPHNSTIPDRQSFNQQQQHQPVARLRLKEEQIA